LPSSAPPGVWRQASAAQMFSACAAARAGRPPAGRRPALEGSGKGRIRGRAGLPGPCPAGRRGPPPRAVSSAAASSRSTCAAWGFRGRARCRRCRARACCSPRTGALVPRARCRLPGTAGRRISWPSGEGAARRASSRGRMRCCGGGGDSDGGDEEGRAGAEQVVVRRIKISLPEIVRNMRNMRNMRENPKYAI